MSCGMLTRVKQQVRQSWRSPLESAERFVFLSLGIPETAPRQESEQLSLKAGIVLWT